MIKLLKKYMYKPPKIKNEQLKMFEYLRFTEQKSTVFLEFSKTKFEYYRNNHLNRHLLKSERN
jgi:hypothetical protein